MDRFSGSLTYVSQQLGRRSLPLSLVLAAVAMMAMIATALVAADALVGTPEPILSAPLRW